MAGGSRCAPCAQLRFALELRTGPRADRMSFFKSEREKRLWLAAAAVIAAIYLTLGVAGSLAERLRSENLLGWAFGLGFVAVILSVVGSALRRRPSRRELWVWLGIFAAYAMVFVRMGVTAEERTHIFEYGLLAVLVHQALVERTLRGGRVRYAALLAIVLVALLGWIDEGIQHLLPNRTYDVRDIGFNALAAVLAVSATSALRWARTWRRTDPAS